ncbi:hypothetical protein OSH11_00265 [Kaistia dalseonensis]|uniref:Uncharacterized protein YjiS (DUF1127 family) n=1 Tax=Kaistia dalseonensis TaxID=410840 RepID=A0ABU0H047_9HYPH|nr:hypothetical protein [Kaistia dalseonensis]MCX5493129.1 hypothetical protein [Kaistia dalseonensis]MDQ0435684.1 uncharacterized protein YjiS (DUF1127 family) [Kaistia dalseonensis]
MSIKISVSGIYRAIVDWAERPTTDYANENQNALWRMSAHELADLPIGPEPDDAPAAFEAERRDRCA